MKYKIQFFLSIAVVLFLTSCGGGGSSPDSNQNNEDEITSNISGLSVNLGYISGATVKIKTLDNNAYVIYETITDSDGFFNVDENKLKKNINSLGYIPNLILIEANDGIDMDPDDDGIIDLNNTIPVKGVVRSVVTYNELISGNISTNLLTTAIYEMLSDINIDNLETGDLDFLSIKIGMTDINNDGVIDRKDTYQYNMVSHESKAESNLRLRLLSSIHNNDTESIRLFVESEKLKNGLAIYKESINNEIANVDIKPIAKNNKIKYSYNSTNLLSESYNLSISLYKGDYLTYQECFDLECYKRQTIYFNGKKTFNFIQAPRIQYIFQDGEIDILKNKYQESLNLYQDLMKNKDKRQQEFEAIKSEGVQIDKKINALDKIGEIFGGSANGNP
ncbi:MAG: hypothetical protein FE834_00035 [Gammaproteobacteria bacterium]|nr:hypothetical protein [Gammaproteobacteria bacterium]